MNGGCAGVVMRGLNYVPARAKISWTSLGGKRKIGRLCIDWMQTVKQVLSRRGFSWNDLPTDIYPIDTVLPVHIVWHHEATAKSTTQDGGMAETYICGQKLRLMHLYRSVE